MYAPMRIDAPVGQGYITDLLRRAEEGGYKTIEVRCEMLDSMDFLELPVPMSPPLLSAFDTALAPDGRPRYVVVTNLPYASTHVAHMIGVLVDTGRVGKTQLVEGDVLVVLNHLTQGAWQ